MFGRRGFADIARDAMKVANGISAMVNQHVANIAEINGNIFQEVVSLANIYSVAPRLIETRYNELRRAFPCLPYTVTLNALRSALENGARLGLDWRELAHDYCTSENEMRAFRP